MSINLNHAAAVLDAQTADICTNTTISSFKLQCVASIDIAYAISFRKITILVIDLIDTTNNIISSIYGNILRCQAAKNHVTIQRTNFITYTSRLISHLLQIDIASSVCINLATEQTSKYCLSRAANITTTTL